MLGCSRTDLAFKIPVGLCEVVRGHTFLFSLFWRVLKKLHDDFMSNMFRLTPYSYDLNTKMK